MCSGGLCHAVEPSAAGDSGVCSAGPAGCFCKGGDPLPYVHTHRCSQAFALTAQGYVVSAACVTAQYARHAESGPGSVRTTRPFL